MRIRTKLRNLSTDKESSIPGSNSKVTTIIPELRKVALLSKGNKGKQDNNVRYRQAQDNPPTRNPLSKGADASANVYDFAQFTNAEDVDGYVSTTFRLTIEQCLKQGYKITGDNAELTQLVDRHIKTICAASSTTVYSMIEDLITGLTKFNNGMLVLTRKEFRGSAHKRYKYLGKNLAPISGMFYVDPEHMTPIKENGKLKHWEYNNSVTGAVFQEFKPHNVFHAFWNRKGSDEFGTPWILPALDDVKMLRRLEEFSQLLISKHLFPIYQYKIGSKEHPAIDFEGGSSEVALVEAAVGDLPQQGCIFTSHRHEVIAIDSNGALDIKEYMNHFDGRALSSLGLNDIDVGRGGASSKSTAIIMNQTRVDRCTRIHKVLTESFNNIIVGGILRELGLDPLAPENNIALVFNSVDTGEERAQQQHDLQMYQNDLITHTEWRKKAGVKPYTEEDWKDTYSNTTSGIASAREAIATVKAAQEKAKAVTSQATAPANQTNKKGKTKPKVPKND